MVGEKMEKHARVCTHAHKCVDIKNLLFYSEERKVK